MNGGLTWNRDIVELRIPVLVALDMEWSQAENEREVKKELCVQ